MNATSYAICITLFSSMSQGENHYTRSSIDKIRENIKKYHKISVGRRWIFQCLSNMLNARLITRKTRHKHHDNGLITQIPSLYSFTIQGIKLLVSRRVTGAAKLLKNMIKFVSGKDQRWPKLQDVKDPVPFEKYTPTGDDWRKLFGIVGKKID